MHSPFVFWTLCDTGNVHLNGTFLMIMFHSVIGLLAALHPMQNVLSSKTGCYLLKNLPQLIKLAIALFSISSTCFVLAFKTPGLSISNQMVSFGHISSFLLCTPLPGSSRTTLLAEPFHQAPLPVQKDL